MSDIQYAATKIWVEPEIKLSKTVCRFMSKYVDILCFACLNLDNLIYDEEGNIIQLICGSCVCKISNKTICPGIGGKCVAAKPATLFVNTLGNIAKVCKACAKAHKLKPEQKNFKVKLTKPGEYINPNPGMVDATWPALN